MREITKTLSLSIDGKPVDFRLTKLDAFSGVSLMRLVSRCPKPEEGKLSLELLFQSASEEEFRSLMVSCLQHTEVLLPAGWIPVMTRGEWTWPDLEHDPVRCLRLTLEEILWTLEGFFAAGASASPPGTPAT